MSETLPALRILLLAVGEAPPLEAAPEGVQEEDAVWARLELDAFFAALDAGEPLPDLVLVPGADPDVLRSLRGHPRACCLPVFAVGATPPGAAGWDGVVSTWSAEWVDTARCLAAAIPEEPSREPLDSARRAHGFARFLSSRGLARLEDARMFGVRAPRSLATEWLRLGWVEADAEETDLLHATPALADAARWSRLSNPAAAGDERPAEPEPTPVEPPEGEPAPPSPVETPPVDPGPWPGGDPEPTPIPPPAEGRGGRRGWVLPMLAILVLALVGTRAAAEAGLVGLRGPFAWLGGGREAAVWEPPRRLGPRLIVPADDPAVAARLAAGDPAFRSPEAPVSVEVRPDGVTSPAVGPGPSPTAEPPVEPQGGPLEPTPAVASSTPPQPERRTWGVTQERARVAIAYPLDGGSITAWQAAPGERIAAGQVLAALRDPRVDAQAAELDALRDGFAGERARRLAESESAWRAEGLRLEAALGQAASAWEAAVGRVGEREAVHARNLELVESGVLGYGEIRADWDALIAARADAARLEGAHADAEARLAAHAVAAPALEPPGAAEALLLARLEAALEQGRAAQVLRAPGAGILRGPLAEAGTPPLAGQPVAFVEDAITTHGVLRLPAEDAGWLSARVLLVAADGVYVPVPVESVARTADGGWELRFRWPAGIAASEAVLERDA